LEDTHKKERLAMARKLTFRQLLVSILALWNDLSHKEIGARTGMPPKRVSLHLRRGELKDETFERLLAAVNRRPAAVPIVTACLEALEALEQDGDLTEDERAEIEVGVLNAARKSREALTEAARLSRPVPVQGYPDAHDLVPARRRAEELFGRLKKLHATMRLGVVGVADDYQSWALCERVCEASVREASRGIEAAAAWARLAERIARRVRGPEGWRHRVQGYAAAHVANVLRVKGVLKQAEIRFEQAKRLWQSGSDPAGVLDPGRLLDLEASLRRAQRRFDQALALLDEAEAVGRCPERALIIKGFTLEVMGEYERAVESLLQAAPRVDRQADPRLWYNHRINLAVTFCHLGRYAEAAELVPQIRGVAAELGDAIFLSRVTWLEGRIAAGLGRRAEALGLLEQARRAFERRKMSYDVALALLEEAVLLLDEGRTAEVKALADELTQVFGDKGVHREALAALRLFHEAAQRQEATAELARRVLHFLFRARYDQGLRFDS
jgi:tetratricopeptide (TPR) repeat protein